MSFLVEVTAVAGAYVAGCVSPAVGRAIKKFLAKEEVEAKSAVAKVDAKLDAELKKVL
jgi:hypothetical protein